MYDTKDFAIDRNNGRLYKIIGNSVTPINLYGFLPEDSQSKMLQPDTTPSQLTLTTPQATSTPVPNIVTSVNGV